METSRGQKSIIWDGYRCRLDGTLKTGDISWRCAKSKPPCKVRIRKDAACSTVISQKKEHSHPQDERHLIRYRAKKKAAEDTCVRPSKIIRSEIQAVDEEALQPNDLKSISKSVYRVRTKTYPPLSKSREGYTRQSLSWLSIHRYTGNPLKRVTFIALKCPHFCRSNVRFSPLICPLNPLKCPSP